MKIYQDKNNDYYQFLREDLLDFIPQNSKNKILEIGAAAGNTLLKAKELGLADEIVGIELNKIENSNQTNDKIDKFIIGNIETMDLELPKEYFDVILCGDVLEHLIDPWGTVKKISTYLKKGGIIISSIPNIREIYTLRDIVIRGNFRYSSAGILDRTHLRFFCKKNMVSLFEQSGLQISYIEKPKGSFIKGSKRLYFNKITFRIFEEFLVQKYIIVARKSI